MPVAQGAGAAGPRRVYCGADPRGHASDRARSPPRV